MVGVAQLVRASDCGPEGRGFKSLHSPQIFSQAIVNIKTFIYFASEHFLKEV